jgi:hypothetical protein
MVLTHEVGLQVSRFLQEGFVQTIYSDIFKQIVLRDVQLPDGAKRNWTVQYLYLPQTVPLSDLVDLKGQINISPQELKQCKFIRRTTFLSSPAEHVIISGALHLEKSRWSF